MLINQSDNPLYPNSIFFQSESSGSVCWLLIGSLRRAWSNLIGSGSISAGICPQAGQLLLHAEVGALAHAEEGGRHGQRQQDEEHAEDGEQQELARLHSGLLHHGDLGQAAPLEDTNIEGTRQSSRGC